MTVRIIKANTVQIMDYYPFGLMWEKQDVTSTDNLKWHHGKELQENEFAQQGKSLDLEDFGARMYDPILGRWWSVDPLAEQRNWLSPYNFVQNNPIVRVDPTGALDDWVQDPLGNVRWDKDANSKETTKPGDTYLGKTLTFVFNSYIDEELWDGPGGDEPAGDKLTSTITVTGVENSQGELTDLKATAEVKIGDTPYGTARNYFPGLGADQNKFGFSGTEISNGLLTMTALNFEQHASVSTIEQIGLSLMGYDIVNVAQNLQLNLCENQLHISAGTDIFPSATLTMNGTQLMHYAQPSFVNTHDRTGGFEDNGMGGAELSTLKLRPAPSFYNRYNK